MAFGTASRQVASCFLLLAVSGMVAPTYSVLAIGFELEFQPSRMVLMLAMTALSLMSGVFSPLCGSLMDKVSLRLMLSIGAVLMVSGFLALSLVSTFTQVIVVYGLLVAPASVLMGPIAATILLSRWFDKRRGAALGIAVSGIALGAALFPPLIQALLAELVWREAMQVLSLVILIVLVSGIAMVVDCPPEYAEHHPDGAIASPAPASATPASTRAIVTDPAFWAIAGLCVVILAGMKGMVTNLVPLAVDEGIPMNRAALLLSLNAACGFVGKLTFAAIADRLGLRPLLVVSLGGYLAGMGCMVIAEDTYWTMGLAVGLIGMFGGMMIPMQGMLVPRLFGTRVVGRVSGLLNAAILCGMLLTPPVFGLMFDLTGSYDTIFAFFVGMAGACLLAVPYIRLEPRTACRA